MSTQFFLDESDIDTLINLLLRSQQLRTREALCLSIGIDPKRLSFIRESSDSDFFLLLTRYLNEIGEKEALCKLCCKELLPVFHQGKYANILSEIAAKLNCDSRLSHNSTNSQQQTVLSSIPFRPIKRKFMTGSAIFVIGLTVIGLIGFPFIKQINNQDFGQSNPGFLTREKSGDTAFSGVCRDPLVTQAVREFTGRAPKGQDDRGECNILLYGNGHWSSYKDLVEKVKEAFASFPLGVCRDSWVNAAVRQVTGKPPKGYGEVGECDMYLYGNGYWGDYPDLVSKVRATLGRV